jgi:hypothetical protein
MNIQCMWSSGLVLLCLSTGTSSRAWAQAPRHETLTACVEERLTGALPTLVNDSRWNATVKTWHRSLDAKEAVGAATSSLRLIEIARDHLVAEVTKAGGLLGDPNMMEKGADALRQSAECVKDFVSSTPMPDNALDLKIAIVAKLESYVLELKTGAVFNALKEVGSAIAEMRQEINELKQGRGECDLGVREGCCVRCSQRGGFLRRCR